MGPCEATSGPMALPLIHDPPISKVVVNLPQLSYSHLQILGDRPVAGRPRSLQGERVFAGPDVPAIPGSYEVTRFFGGIKRAGMGLD